ncbi:MAG: hypothetical protein AB1489_16090 [Acidobacteriota bacterium]
MSAQFAPNPKLLRIYKRVLLDFKLIWAIKRHYETLAFSIGDESLTATPIDLNRVYGTLKVIYEMLQKTDSPALVARLEGAAKDLVATLEWFRLLDQHISPYQLRIYLERADVDTHQLRTFARYFLNKSKPTFDDFAKADYLLARAFSWIDDTGMVRINVESEEKLEIAITRLLPRPWRKRKPAGYLAAAARIVQFIEQLQDIGSYDELISSGLINAARHFKSELRENFYSAMVLSKCVQLNVDLRNRFERFYREENQRLRQFSLALVGANAELVQDWLETRQQEVTLSSALQFSEQASELISADYTQTRPYLEQLSRLRDMLQRTIMLHGLDPHGAATSEVASMASVLNNHDTEDLENVDAGLQLRLNSLNELIRTIHTGPRPATVKVLHLENSTLVLSSWEFDAFKPSPQDNYFARLSYDVLKRSVALIAEIQENLALYRLYENSPQLANQYLIKVNFYVLQAQKIAEELEDLSNSARERHEIDTACNLSATCQKVLDSYNRLKPLLEKAVK